MGTTTLAANEVEVTMEAVEKAFQSGDKYVLDTSGNPAIVMLPVDSYNELLDRLEELEDARDSDRIMAAIKSGEEDTVPWSVIRERLLAEEALDE